MVSELNAFKVEISMEKSVIKSIINHPPFFSRTRFRGVLERLIFLRP